MTRTDSKPAPTFELETDAANKFSEPVAGVDEAGRGPWAGPVVAAAVILDQRNIPEGLNDSKKLTANKREILFEEIKNSANIGIGIAEVDRIDEMNILQASLWSMAQAVANLSALPSVALIDGNKIPKLPCPALPIVKGDSKSLSIAAASIIAKVTRDRIMEELAQDYPHFAWEKNKGYGTKAHIAGLAKHGVTIHHRRSFKPVQALLKG